MENFINILIHIIQSHAFLFSALVISFVIKIFLILWLMPLGAFKKINQSSWLLLIGTIFGATFGDIAWLVKSGRIVFFPDLSYEIVTFFIRIAWAFLVIQYQSMALFVGSLANKSFSLSLYQKVCLGISSLFSGYFFYSAFFSYHYLCDEASRTAATQKGGYFEFQLMQIISIYLLIALVVPALYHIMQRVKSEMVPKILTKQLKIFTLFFIIPFFMTEFMLGLCIKTVDTGFGRPLVAISTLLLIATICYCLKKIMGLRFLNSSAHVDGKANLSMIEDFKTVLEQLGNANSLHELSHITQTFFKEAFNIAPRSVSFILREKHYDDTICSDIHHAIELFLSTLDTSIKSYINEHGILSYDELSFDQFYQENSSTKTMVDFLNRINADIFLPIYIKNKIVGAIIVARNARVNCFSKAEHDAMLVFSNYVTNIINLLQHKNLDTLIHKEKQLQEELYQRHQEINQYKESINSFLRHTKQKPIGIIFYKNKTFTLGNQAAKELIKIDINKQAGHPLTKAFSHVAHQVELFKAPYTQFARNEYGNILILSGVPHLQQNQVIITIVYPDISDIIAKQMDQLHNPHDWDYILYLESTSAGFHINEIVPSSAPAMLNFKIDLLKAALSKRALLLDMPDEDVSATVERIHHISLRETLHTLELSSHANSEAIACKLFGTNPLLKKTTPSTSLLKTLHSNGTLFIKNIHLADMALQDQLADFILYGYYRLMQSEQREYSSARIICSTNQNIARLVQENKFSLRLFEALKPIITMPSLSTIDTSELYSLIDGFTDQALKTNTFKNMLALNDKEKERLIQIRPASLSELKTKVQQQLIKKTKESNIHSDMIFDPAYEVSDPDLIHAARLGKQALKDQKIMGMLWHKFKSQSKIALFLGINRSSVHRRFKTLNLDFDGKETAA